MMGPHEVSAASPPQAAKKKFAPTIENLLSRGALAFSLQPREVNDAARAATRALRRKPSRLQTTSASAASPFFQRSDVHRRVVTDDDERCVFWTPEVAGCVQESSSSSLLRQARPAPFQ